MFFDLSHYEVKFNWTALTKEEERDYSGSRKFVHKNGDVIMDEIKLN